MFVKPEPSHPVWLCNKAAKAERGARPKITTLLQNIESRRRTVCLFAREFAAKLPSPPLECFLRAVNGEHSPSYSVRLPDSDKPP